MPLAGGAAAPEWVHLLPLGTVPTYDGRGPYRVENADALARQSMETRGQLVLDENHATDLAAPQGREAPARGWIVALEARQDGIWGKVQWTATGKALVEDRAYRFLSPVITHDAQGRVTGLLRASLVNLPNLRGLAALNQEHNMDLLAQLRELLGLAADADAPAVISTVKDLKGSTQSVDLKPIAKAAGLKDDADQAAVLQAVQTLATAGKGAGDQSAQIVALQSELATLGTAHKTLQDGIARDKATLAVDAAIAAGKPGVKALRDHYISRHMADAAGVAKELDALPSLTKPSGAQPTPPAKDKDGKVALNAEQLAAAKALGIKPEDYAKTLAAELEAGATIA
jgi:phage I-like protein